MDCDESSMQKTLQERSQDRSDDNPAAIAARIHYYKYNTLPVIAHYDEADKLYIVSTINLQSRARPTKSLNLRPDAQNL